MPSQKLVLKFPKEITDKPIVYKLIKDGGIRGIVIKLSRCCNTIKIKETVRKQVKLTAGAGVSLKRLLTFAVNGELSGLEFLSGIPGSVGGALAMNAGAQDKEIKDVTDTITFLTPQAKVIEQSLSELHFDYRSLALPRGTVILKTVLKMKRSTKSILLGRIEKINAWRRRVQPLNLPSAGSVFKNREGIEIDFLLASQKANRVHAYEIKRGKVNRHSELNRLIGKTARLTFKSIKLHNPQIIGYLLNLSDMW